MVQRKKFIGMKTRFYTYQSHIHCIAQPKEKSRKPLATPLELGHVLSFELKLQLVRNQGDEFGIGWLAVAFSVPI